MWSDTQYRKLVRASGIYDLVVTIGFATPWSFALLHGWLSGLHDTFGLAGEIPLFGAMHVMMANLMGSIVCVWAWLRIRHPEYRFGRYDAAGRVLFSAWQVYALVNGASALIWGVLVLEVLWAIAQLAPVSRTPAIPVGGAFRDTRPLPQRPR
ncbi:hypothetical protein SE916_00065 [Pseudomonas sp. 5FOS]|jgi:hypothetical protein|uniref:hypothetical protein n=1 Tax=unclassified Pseudomonas TaxID=196821 RepID=UPI001A9D6029|nr:MULTISPECIES: hypothetical protein [unclassified Pseudomonas]MCE5985712.1 hypothetical protein [Pseudomonas sp. LM20]UMY64250.1 hypothetical protein MKK04_18190 [Pseudomonas sp. LS.1a]